MIWKPPHPEKPKKKERKTDAEYCDNWIGDFPPDEWEDDEPEYPEEWE